MKIPEIAINQVERTASREIQNSFNLSIFGRDIKSRRDFSNEKLFDDKSLVQEMLI